MQSMREKHQRCQRQKYVDQEQRYNESETSFGPREAAIGNGGDRYGIERPSEEKQRGDGRWHTLVIAQLTECGKAQFFAPTRT